MILKELEEEMNYVLHLPFEPRVIAMVLAAKDRIEKLEKGMLSLAEWFGKQAESEGLECACELVDKFSETTTGYYETSATLSLLTKAADLMDTVEGQVAAMRTEPNSKGDENGK